MPIVEADIKLKLSVKTGSAGDTTAQADPDESLGKYVSTTELVDATLNNLFDDVTGGENAASEAEYRCIFVHNTHATLTLQSAVVWLSAEVAGGAAAAISVDTTAASDADSSSAQAKEVVDENTAPATQTFSSPTTKGAGLALGSLAPDEVRAIWVRRTAANSAALNNDGVTIRVEGDTAE